MRPLEITTERLRIIPLDLRQFSLLLDAQAAMEADLRLAPSFAVLEGHELDAMRWLHGMASAHRDDHLWYTNWQIVLSSANLSIGSCCFKGGPNAAGEVELGYGIRPPCRNNGYMTEAARALCRWALERRGVIAVIAETDKDNPASRRICLKCAMEKSGETSSTILWRLTRAGHIADGPSEGA